MYIVIFRVSIRWEGKLVVAKLPRVSLLLGLFAFRFCLKRCVYFFVCFVYIVYIKIYIILFTFYYRFLIVVPKLFRCNSIHWFCFCFTHYSRIKWKWNLFDWTERNGWTHTEREWIQHTGARRLVIYNAKNGRTTVVIFLEVFFFLFCFFFFSFITLIWAIALFFFFAFTIVIIINNFLPNLITFICYVRFSFFFIFLRLLFGKLVILLVVINYRVGHNKDSPVRLLGCVFGFAQT